MRKLTPALLAPGEAGLAISGQIDRLARRAVSLAFEPWSERPTEARARGG